MKKVAGIIEEQTYSRFGQTLDTLESKKTFPRVQHVGANYLMMPQLVHMLPMMRLGLINYLTEMKQEILYNL